MHKKVRVEIDDEAAELLSKAISDLDVQRPIVWIDERERRQGDVTRGADGKAVWRIEDFPPAWNVSIAAARTDWPKSYFKVVRGFEVMAPFARLGVVALRVTGTGGELRVESVP